MRNRVNTRILTAVLLAVFLVSLSCNDASQNKPSPNLTNNTAANNTAQNSPTPVTADCSGDEPTKLKKIKDGVRNNIKKDSKLESQYANKRFEIESQVKSTGSDDAILYIWGKVYTSANDLNELNKTYKDFMKKGCVTNVIFGPPPPVPANPARQPDFEYELCEAPNKICGDGSCQSVCP